MKPITISTIINASKEKVWQCLTEPSHITKWNFASDDWQCPSASVDLKEGGKFSSRMEAKDGSAGFDFNSTIDSLVLGKSLHMTMEDGRKWNIDLEETEDGQTNFTETFDPENENPEEMQREGWSAILENFKKYCESLNK